MRPAMRYNRVGTTDIRISAVGFGTCQLRLVPEEQALETLKRGFALGVNWVHTAPDYEGAEEIVARAIAESGHDVMAFSQGFGDTAHFEYLFERTCRLFKKTRLEMFGIACISVAPEAPLPTRSPSYGAAYHAYNIPARLPVTST